jgi:hypothetical protein
MSPSEIEKLAKRAGFAEHAERPNTSEPSQDAVMELAKTLYEKTDGKFEAPTHTWDTLSTGRKQLYAFKVKCVLEERELVKRLLGYS